MSDIDGVKFVGRHTPEEYAEFYECLDAAADKGADLRNHFGSLL